MLVSFEDTAELDLRVVVSLTPAEIMALRAGLPMSFALMAAHADGVRCVLVSSDVSGAEARAKMEFPTGRILTVTDAELERLHDGRGGVRIKRGCSDAIPFCLAIAKLRPARPSRPLTPPELTPPPSRPWRRGVRVAFALSMAVVILLAIGDIQAVSIGLGLFILAVGAWLAWDAWGRPRAQPEVAPASSKPVATVPSVPTAAPKAPSPLARAVPDAVMEQLSASSRMTGPHGVVSGHPRTRASLTG